MIQNPREKHTAAVVSGSNSKARDIISDSFMVVQIIPTSVSSGTLASRKGAVRKSVNLISHPCLATLVCSPLGYNLYPGQCCRRLRDALYEFSSGNRHQPQPGSKMSKVILHHYMPSLVLETLMYACKCKIL